MSVLQTPTPHLLNLFKFKVFSLFILKDFSYRKSIDIGPKDFVIANDKDVKTLEEKCNELEKRIEGLYDILEELLKKLD